MPTPATSTTGTIAATEHTVWDQVTLKSFMDQAFADAKREGILPGTEIPRHKNPFSQKGIVTLINALSYCARPTETELVPT